MFRWYTDSSFKQLPARASLLYARSIPPIGGHTEFADERAAYDALPEETKLRLNCLVAEHSIFNSRARLGFTNFSDEEQREMPTAPQVVVRTIPESGRKSLYVASHAGRIFGMPEHESRALIDQLIAHATQRQFVLPIAGLMPICVTETIKPVARDKNGATGCDAFRLRGRPCRIIRNRVMSGRACIA
jgi:alpha-ketoglutarate-dependent 2,4-dichlorophenoxyacetate dioxygenase